MPEKVLKSPDLGLLEKRGDPDNWVQIRGPPLNLPIP